MRDNDVFPESEYEKRKRKRRNKRIAVSLVSIIAILVAGVGLAEVLTEGGLSSYIKLHTALLKPDVNEEVIEDEPLLDVVEEIKPTNIIFTGDVYLSDYVLSNYDSAGLDGVLSTGLQAKLTSADILMVNNEFPYSTRGEQAPDKQYTFRVDPKYVEILNGFGVDIAGLANNHVLDFGRDALLDTFDTLDGAGIEYTGAGKDIDDASKLIIKEVNGKKYGFLAASRVIPSASWNIENGGPGVFCTYDTTRLVEEIGKAKERCDYVFVCVHWGTEHTAELEDYQKEIGHALIDAGADGVIGAHPHCLQGIEFYNDRPIFYSLGNFIFNMSIEKTVAVEFTIDENGNEIITLIPASAVSAKTSLLTDSDATNIYKYLESISTGIKITDDGVLEKSNDAIDASLMDNDELSE